MGMGCPSPRDYSDQIFATRPRLEEEKLNVWSALFNLENSFGTHEGLMTVCKEAAAVNDSKAVFLRLAAVLDKSKKYQVN